MLAAVRTTAYDSTEERVMFNPFTEVAEGDPADLMSIPASAMPQRALSKHIGTTRITDQGSDQLSYKPASTKKTSTTPSAKALNGFCCKSRSRSTLLDCFCK